jgi:hypothetical protein
LGQFGADTFKLIGNIFVSATGRKARTFDRYLSQALCMSVGHGYCSSSAAFINRDQFSAMPSSSVRRMLDKPFLRLSRRHSASLSRHNLRFNNGGGIAVMRAMLRPANGWSPSR